MTADELFLKHAAKYLGRYKGNLHWFCEAVKNDHVPQPPFAATEPFGIEDATSLGGGPMWLQDAPYPRCPECQQVMKFLAQFDDGSMTPPEEGIYYSFYCSDCPIAAVNYQQT